ncbi:MAG: hypothetical protein V2A34_02150 [Lentisphaerota bacterium]
MAETYNEKIEKARNKSREYYAECEKRAEDDRKFARAKIGFNKAAANCDAEFVKVAAELPRKNRETIAAHLRSHRTPDRAEILIRQIEEAATSNK